MLTIQQIYDLSIKLGIQHDLRGPALVLKRLRQERERYQKMDEEGKNEYDLERLKNPYSDTRVLHGEPRTQVRRAFVGIDIDTSELLLAQHLSQAGKKIDLVIAHHPIGPALAGGLHEVMELQVELMAKFGVPINVAQQLTHLRISEVARGVGASNHSKAVFAAQHLGLPLMCTHTVTDNLVGNFLDKLIRQNQRKLERVGDILNLLKTIPEYQEAIRQKNGPVLFSGKPDNFTGRIALSDITGGTEGSKEMYAKLANAGVGTVIGMHMQEEHKKQAEAAHLNVLIAGHMSSDSIGMNLLMDELEKKGVEIVPTSGFIRVSRVKKLRIKN